MPKETKPCCPECGEEDDWIWHGWTWRKDAETGKRIKNVHQRRCSCGKLYGVVDNEGYRKREEAVTK